jgi:hypothetical protein
MARWDEYYRFMAGDGQSKFETIILRSRLRACTSSEEYVRSSKRNGLLCAVNTLSTWCHILYLLKNGLVAIYQQRQTPGNDSIALHFPHVLP